MDSTDQSLVQRWYRQNLGLRIGPEMAAWVQRQLQSADGRPLGVIGADARTGLAVCRELSAAQLPDMLKPLPLSISEATP
jgi:hypothetical protein